VSQPDPAPSPLSRSATATLVSGLAALLGAVFFFPMGLILGLGALVVGWRTLRTARAAGAAAPSRTAVGMTLGALGAGLAVLVGLVVVIFWPQLRDYESCRAGANTQIAQQACDTQLRTALLDRIGR
jgi:hypothetical protein